MRKLTIETIRDKIFEKHNNIKLISNGYTNSKEKLIFYCTTHNIEFKYSYDKIMKVKNPYPLCNSKLNISIIPILAEKHNNKYDYSLFLNSKRKIDIICKEHGIFTQDIYTHLNGSGCPKCFGMNKNNLEFINQCNIIHNNKYNYSKTNYTKTQDNIIIICEIHGEFTQKANNHLNGQGCKLCATNVLHKNEYINILNILFDNKYDYSLMNFYNKQSYIKVLCNIHEEFEIKLSLHLNGHGCKKCASDALRYTNEEFISKSNIIHNFKYNYSLCEYTGNKDKVTILCGKHGKFKQIPNDHLNGAGCPICKSSKGELAIRNYLEFHNIKYSMEYKFDGCYNKLKLPFDFYLPDFNICIEFDGKQHFEANEFFGGNNAYKKLKQNDAIKTKYCAENNIKLIRITYDVNIEDILSVSVIKNSGIPPRYF